MALREPPQATAGTQRDSILAALRAEPFRIQRPVRQTLAFVFASPHSGRAYPASLVTGSRLDALTLRRSEDAFVDELFAAAAALGAPFITASFPRAYCDANRGPGELDRTMFSGPLAVPVDVPGPRVTAGLGVIPRIVRDGAEIYRAKLPPDEAKARLEHLYRPYHAALAKLAEETTTRFGTAVIVDCHSMPSALSAPDIVLGDRYGASASSTLTDWAQSVFADAGFSVARNAPYAGGYTTALYGRGVLGCQALQIEVNRSLYLDEDSLQRSPAFAAVRQRLEKALARLVTLPLAQLGPRTASLAAE